MELRSKEHDYSLRAIVSSGLFVLSSVSVIAQAGRGGISGTVLDNSGAHIPGASVVARDTAKGTKLSTVTTAAGVYSFVSVAPGTYTVTITHAGFDTAVQNNVIVSVDQVSTVNTTLQVGSLNETVTVDASSSLVDASNSTVGQIISAQQIDRVPLVTRDVYQLVQLSAGVSPANGTPNSSDNINISNARSLADVSSYTVNGSLQGNVYYMVDGSPIGIAESNLATIIPAFEIPEDGVEEFRVETQNTPATYTSGGGGVISLVTKSGSNKLHGDVFGYFRPNAFAANDFFNKMYNPGQGTPDFHRYQEGGSISGPIKKDKLFFFGDYEATQQALLDTGTFTVPTAAERTGDFSADGLTIYNPLVPDNPDGTRQAFAGNVIPTADLDPVALKFANLFPLPNRPGDGPPYHVANYVAAGLDPFHAQKFDIRLDYAQSEKNRIFGRFSYGRLNFGNANLYNNPYDPFYFVNITNTRNVLIGDDLTINPTTVLQLRYSFTRHYEDQTGDPRQVGSNITDFGFPQSLADQVVYKQAPVIYFGITAAIGGTGNDNTFLYASENSDANATLTKIFGKHEISTGFEYQKKFLNVGQPPAPAGAYNFDNTATSSTTFAGDGSDFASFLIGVGSAPGGESSNFTKDVIAAEANPYYGVFLQDNFHVTPKLTLNLGLRWDIFGGRTERHNRQEYWDPNQTFTAGGVNLKGGERFVTPGARSPYTTNLKDLGPRASFAWQPQTNFVIRGGAGIYYGPSQEMVAFPYFNTDGFGSVSTWNATIYNADGNTVPLDFLSNPFPAGLVQPTGSTLGPATNLGAGLSTVYRSPRTITTYNFNLGFEYQFPGDTVFSLAYVGSRGLFLPLAAVDLNQLSLQTIAQYNGALCVTGAEPNCVNLPNPYSAVFPATNPFYGATTIPQWLALEPYPQFNNGGFGQGVVINGLPGADSEYSSLQTKIQKRMSHHISTLATFTWSKLITDDSQPPFAFVGYHTGAPQDWRNLNLEHSVSGQDIRFQFNWQLSWDLPIGKGRALNLNGISNTLLGGWTVNTITYLSDGVPIASPTGTGNPYFNQRVDLTCDPRSSAMRKATQWFSPTCFAQPASQYLPGTAPAYIGNLRADGAHQADVSVYKVFPLPRESNVRLEVAAFNVSNTVQYAYPNVFWNADYANNPSVLNGFGSVTGSANQPRQFQFGARYTF